MTISEIEKMLRPGAAEDVRVEKVAALRQAIASGTYRIPAAAVAAKIIEDMLQR